ncbi:hypothetical protein VNO78_15827 [Psophocarpus tetragonolobus]|uniref:PGG domain-containing protein n=1 Tax=Psophocarpus tetragonolobus TaxID=3891 RepID=A0AAN9XK89_PSOTE
MAAGSKLFTFPDKIVEAQKAAVAKNWESLKDIFKDKKLLFEKVDLFGNTVIHAAVRANQKQLLKDLLNLLTPHEQLQALRKPNDERNTPLHEAVLLNDPVMVDMIMERISAAKDIWTSSLEQANDSNEIPPSLEQANDSNETPPFRAAKHGKLSVLKHLHAKYGPLTKQKHLKPAEFLNKKRPIIHTCVLTFKFGVAIWLLKNVDKSLAKEKLANLGQEREEIQEVTSLKLLSRMPMAFKSTETLKMGFTKLLLYNLLPEDGYESEVEEDAEVKVQVNRPNDTEEGSQPDDGNKRTTKSKVAVILSRVNHAFWKRATGLGYIKQIWKQKKKHKFAERLVKLLLENEHSWKNFPPLIGNMAIEISPDFPSNVTQKREHIELKDRVRKEEREKKLLRKWKQEGEKHLDKREKAQESEEKHLAKKTKGMWETPLLLAAASGIVEVVKQIVDKYPEAISYVNEDGLNILHVAITHRQSRIYEYIESSPAFASLKPRISKYKRTILHQAASMDYYREEALAGVAYQLQSELEWYHKVQVELPRQYLMHADENGLTAGDLLDIDHAKMHDEAKQWMKETAQSCSTVAVLIAGVVFAAAYAIPGEKAKKGSPAFRIFTIMDVVALATSLASVVMFLSILTSSFELWDFHKSLPRKLKWGFSFLFIALITTMLSFAATILLIIHMEGNKNTTTLAYSLAFVVVSLFGLTQFPLYKMLEDLYKNFKNVKKRHGKKIRGSSLIFH